MRTYSKKTVKEFGAEHHDVKEELAIWYAKVEAANWADFNALREDMPATDYIGNDRYVFNVKGNHYRVIAMIFFGSRQLFIRGIYPHKDYSKLSKKDITNL
jgi:mRNA interferase HigB